jgi:hypothetical protein
VICVFFLKEKMHHEFIQLFQFKFMIIGFLISLILSYGVENLGSNYII